MNDNVGKVDGTIQITLAAHDRRHQQFDPGLRQSGLPHVRQSAYPANLNLTSVEEAFSFLPRNAVDEFDVDTKAPGKVSRNFTAELVRVLSHTGSYSQRVF